MKKFLLVALALFSGAAFAQTATVTWTNPTLNTDGSAIPATGPTALASTRVEYGSCSGTAFGTKAGEVVVPQPSTTTTITSLTAGSTYCFRAYAKNVGGAESGPSVVVSKAIPLPVPNPPVLSATITVAYEAVPDQWDGVKLGRAVGTLALGTTCIDNPIQTNKGEYYEVPLDKVTLTKVPKPNSRIVTKCAWIG